MLKATVDTHTHTIVSGHAYSTIIENAKAAFERGLEGFAATDHTPFMGDTRFTYFFNLAHTVPPYVEGVRVLAGAELNIIDFEGTVDLEERVLKGLELVIASAHTLEGFSPGSVADHTRMYQKIAENPYVNIIGHCGQGAFSFEMEPVMKAFKENGKIVEINSHSRDARPGSDINCIEIARACKAYGIPVVVSSDAHFANRIGDFSDSLALLEEIDFPEELLVNRDLKTLLSFLPRARKVAE